MQDNTLKTKVCKNCGHECHCDTLVCVDCNCIACLHEGAEESLKFPDWG